jgi:hypothetical protein
MKKKIRPLNLALLLSLPFLAAGLMFTISAYYKLAATEAAAEQIEFLKNLPYVINAGDRLKMPVYCENVIMKGHPSMRGELTCYYYENRVSLRAVRTVVRQGLFNKTGLICVIDARSRN